MKKIYKVKLMMEHTYFVKAENPKQAIEKANSHLQDGTCSVLGAWRQQTKRIARRVKT